jgi:non-heme chloroperoxidase
MDTMSRRKVVGAGAAWAGGLGVLAGCAGSEAWPAPAAAAPATDAGTRAASFLEMGDGATLFYLDWGGGAPVLFTHAWALNADLWEYQMVALTERGLRCVAYDRRGHGRSRDPGHGYDFDTLADDLAHVLDTLDLRDVTLVGHSMGCGEIARYLSRHGAGRVARAVLVSTVTPLLVRTPDHPEGADPGVYEAIIAALKADRPATFAAGVAQFAGPSSGVSPELSDWIVQQFLRASPRAAIECTRALARADFRGDMSAFTIPTLIVHGDADEVNPLERTGQSTAQAIPASVLRVYEGGPHGLIVSHKDRLSADLLSFVQR